MSTCNFGVKSYSRYQCVLRVHQILKTCTWFQTKLHKTKFDYHYLFIYSKVLCISIVSLFLVIRNYFIIIACLAGFCRGKERDLKSTIYPNLPSSKACHAGRLNARHFLDSGLIPPGEEKRLLSGEECGLISWTVAINRAYHAGCCNTLKSMRK